MTVRMLVVVLALIAQGLVVAHAPTVAFPMLKTPGPIYEYACHEGNYGLVGILAGARAEERKATEEAERKKQR